MKDLLNNENEIITIVTIEEALRPLPRDYRDVLAEHLLSLRDVIVVDHPNLRSITEVDNKGSFDLLKADNPTKELKSFNEIIRFTRAY